MDKPQVEGSKAKFHVFRDERFTDLNLYQFGWERTSPAHSYGPHARNHYLFHYIIAGHGVLQANEQEYAIGPGHGFLVVPGQITTYRSDEQDPWEYTWLEFDGLRAHESLTLAGIGEHRPVYTARSAEAGAALQQEMLYIVDHSDASPIHLIAHGYLFLDQLVQSSAGRQEGREHRLRDFYIKEALVYIDHNFQRDISIEELHYRMARAAQLLKETRLPVGEIARQVSYDNPLHFSRAFKNVHGVSPREYRASHLISPEHLPPSR